MSQHFKKKGDQVSSNNDKSHDIEEYKHVSMISSNIGGYQYQKTSDPENVYMLMDYEDNTSQKFRTNSYAEDGDGHGLMIDNTAYEQQQLAATIVESQ